MLYIESDIDVAIYLLKDKACHNLSITTVQCFSHLNWASSGTQTIKTIEYNIYIYDSYSIQFILNHFVYLIKPNYKWAECFTVVMKYFNALSTLSAM